jgi:hypothetical protein
MNRHGNVSTTYSGATRTPRKLREAIGIPPWQLDGSKNVPGPTHSHGRCRSCDAPIIWAVTPAGRPMPVNSEPVPYRGNIRLEVQPDGRPPLACAIPVMYCFGRRDLYLSHFVDCPEADKWRHKR